MELGSTKDGKRKAVGLDEPVKEGNLFAGPSNVVKPKILASTDQRGKKGKDGKVRPKALQTLKPSATCINSNVSFPRDKL